MFGNEFVFCVAALSLAVRLELQIYMMAAGLNQSFTVLLLCIIMSEKIRQVSDHYSPFFFTFPQGRKPFPSCKLNFDVFFFSRIDPASNHIDLSLRGKDVDGPDPAPPPKRKKEDKETKSKKFKSRDGEEDDEDILSDNETTRKNKQWIFSW